MDMIFLSHFPLGHSGGFALNTNILDTNIINLVVVLGVLFTVGGDALKATLANRKEAILSTMQEAEERVKQRKFVNRVLWLQRRRKTKFLCKQKKIQNDLNKLNKRLFLYNNRQHFKSYLNKL